MQVTQEKVQFLKDAAAWSKFTDALDLEVSHKLPLQAHVHLCSLRVPHRRVAIRMSCSGS